MASNFKPEKTVLINWEGCSNDHWMKTSLPALNERRKQGLNAVREEFCIIYEWSYNTANTIFVPSRVPYQCTTTNPPHFWSSHYTNISSIFTRLIFVTLQYDPLYWIKISDRTFNSQAPTFCDARILTKPFTRERKEVRFRLKYL